MKTAERVKRAAGQGGFILVLALLVMLAATIMGMASIFVSNQEVLISGNDTIKSESFYLADGAMEFANTFVNRLGNGFDAWLRDPVHADQIDGTTFRTKADLAELRITLNGKSMIPVIEGPPMGPFTVTVTGESKGARTSLIGTLQPVEYPFNVFDYAYFINNWGWMYGSSITCNGDVRSNGNFDFSGPPKINGSIYASGVTNGSATQPTGTVRKDKQDIAPMPNLKDISYYEALAKSKAGTLKYYDPTISAYRTVQQVYGDDIGEKSSLYLNGTTQYPIIVDGPVVVRGDIIIKGVVSGQGTLYAGRNQYVAGNITYAAPPTTARPTSTQTKDDWVDLSMTKDLVAFAANGSFFLGDYTAWTSTVGSYLYAQGREDGVGPDGIPDTADDTTADNVLQPWEDRDEDGIMDYNYTLNNDVKTTLTNFDNLPVGTTAMNQVAANNITKLEGVFYTNHAFAGQVGATTVNGSVISKDEAIIYSSNLTFNYDERTNSRYSGTTRFVDLGLPKLRKMVLADWRVVN
jgi:hypothetical protein